MKTLNARELDVLNILFKKGEPMMVTDIVCFDMKKGLTQSTVTAVLRKMLQDNIVEVVGVTHSGKVLSRTYRPAPAAKEAVLQYFSSCYLQFQDMISPEELFKYIKICKERAKEQG